MKEMSRVFGVSGPSSSPLQLRMKGGASAAVTCFDPVLLLIFSSFVPIHSSSSLFKNPNLNPNPNPILPNHKQLAQKCKFGFDNLQDALQFVLMLQMRPPSPLYHPLQSTISGSRQNETLLRCCLSVFRYVCFKNPGNARTISTVINSCCHSNRSNFGFSSLAGIFKCGFLPHVVTYNTLIRGLLAENRFVEAETLLKKLIRMNVVSFNTIIDGLSEIIDTFCKDKQVNDALGLLSEMIEKGVPPSVVTYNSIIHVLCNLDRWREINDMFVHMDYMKISPVVYTFNILVNAQCIISKVKDAEHVVKMMSQTGVNPDVIN